MSGMRRIPTIACSLALISLLGSAAFAQTTRVETLRWTDSGNPVGSVVEYEVQYGTSSGSYGWSKRIPVPPIVDGAYEALVPMSGAPLDANLYIALTAVNSAGLESFYSNEICRAPGGGACGTSGGGTTTPPPPSTTASAGINGFALWNAQSDAVIDGNFTNGEKVQLANGTCFAIEILTNSYLSSGAGSVKKVFDGQDNGCTQVGVTHENSPPFAWEADAGPGKFECASTLTLPGTHTLTVTPYDGRDCSGLVGTAKTLSFEVVPATGSGGSTVGQPGQPFLIQ